MGWSLIMPRFAVALPLVLTLALLIPAKTAEANEDLPRFSLETGVGSLISYYHSKVAGFTRQIAA